MDKHPNMDTSPRVLVVDDEENIRQFMWLMLRREFDITTVENGFEAVKQIQQGNDFAVVSLDLRMPGMSGIDTLREIKQLSPATEVLIVTGYADVESAKKAVKLGAYDYIDKPVDKELLRAAIRHGAELHRKRTAREAMEAELTLVKAKLIHSDRLSAIGELIANVTHELRSPLTGILGYSELLLGVESMPEGASHYAQHIHEATLLCEQIIQKLLSFTRKEKPQQLSMQINAVIETSLALKERQLELDDIEVKLDLADDLPATMVDPYQLEQVFLNLLNNAHQAMRGQERARVLTVSTKRSGERIQVCVRDTGPGIPPDRLQRIFEPFFTTKEKGEGTGLGLSISYDIIQEHQGDIYVASDVSEGACFLVELPIVQQQNGSEES